MFIKHLAIHHDIFSAFVLLAKMYRPSHWRINANTNNIPTISNNFVIGVLRNAAAFSHTGHAIINAMSMIDIKSIWGVRAVATFGIYFFVRYQAISGMMQ